VGATYPKTKSYRAAYAVAYACRTAPPTSKLSRKRPPHAGAFTCQRSGLQWLARKSGILRLLRLQEMESLLPAIPHSFLIPANQYYEPPATLPSNSTPVALFAGCIMSTAFAGTDRATIRVLLAHGCSVIVPASQGCCGALTIHAGDMDEARIMARQNIDAFERSGAGYIIVNAAGCGAALKEYAHLFHEDPHYAERAEHFSAQVRDITEFLADRPVTPPQQPLALKVTYQEACHLVHAQRISQQPRKLLRSIPGIELIEMQESALCCGTQASTTSHSQRCHAAYRSVKFNMCRRPEPRW
jgi:glycolate oxidase iron-sulfur subunit